MSLPPPIPWPSLPLPWGAIRSNERIIYFSITNLVLRHVGVPAIIIFADSCV